MTAGYHSSWASLFQAQFAQPYMHSLSAFLQEERQLKEIFPPEALVFHAFELTALEDVKVVILGQDPYHNYGQAHGLSFSVPDGMPIPPSLRNIYTELISDIPGFKLPATGDLSHWAKQGVLLLNATLTVEAHHAGTHQKKGWEAFTNSIIRSISEEREGLVFMLWGGFAHKKASLIDAQKHLILRAVHPSPLSVYRGFYGSQHFSQANRYLLAQGKSAIDWQI